MIEMLGEKEIDVCVDTLSQGPDDCRQLTVKEVKFSGIIMASCWQTEKVLSATMTRTLQGHKIH